MRSLFTKKCVRVKGYSDLFNNCLDSAGEHSSADENFHTLGYDAVRTVI